MEFTKNGVTLLFYKKEGDKMYSFVIKDNAYLTEKVLDSVKTHRVKASGIKYAKEAIFSIIENHNFKNKTIMGTNPITALAEAVQKKYGRNIETRVVDKTGADHAPTITVEIELPNGEVYYASGANQKEAKQRASRIALDDMDL